MLPLLTERLLLRNFRASDAPALAAYRSQPEVARFQAWDAPFSLEDAERMIASLPDTTPPPAGEWQQIALERRSDGVLVGDLAICTQFGYPQQIELGYTLAREHQQQGYAREGLRALLDVLFRHDVHRIHGLVDHRNLRSARLLRSLGFRHEGRFVEHMSYKGELVTDDQFALLAREWPAVGSLQLTADSDP